MVLYVKRYCPWCIEAMAYLDREGFHYELVDVLADAEAYARMREVSGQSLTPTMEVAGKVLADFDVGQLKEFLGENGIAP